MAADVNILREFLVRIGFNVDDVQFKKVQGAVEKATGVLEDLGEATGVVSYLVERNVTRVAATFDKLYYSSARVGASVGSLQAYTFGAQQIGVSAEEATGQLAGLNRAMRDNPGISAYLSGALGIKTQGRETTEIAGDLLDRMAKMPAFLRAQVGSMVGWDSDTIAMLLRNRDVMKKMEADHNRRVAAAGFNPQKLAAQSVAFTRQMDILHDDMAILEGLVATKLLPALTWLVGKLDGVLQFADRADKATGGASTDVGIGLGVLGALAGKRFIQKRVGNALKGFRGAGSAAEATEAAAGTTEAVAGAAGAGEAVAGAAVAGEAAAAAGGTAIAFGTGIGEVALVVAAVAAILGFSIYELHEHWQQVQNASNNVRDWVDGKLKQGAQAIKNEAKFEADETMKEGRQFVGWVSKGLDAFTKGAEGKRLTRYGDLAGYGTIGYGHKILPGEHFGASITDAQADALYLSDKAKAQRRVAALTKGLKLGGGQLDALADFQFSTGGLAGSKLMTLVRSGKFEAAAKEFEKWDHVRMNGHLVESQGLLNRRLGEESMFRGGVQIHQKTDIHINGSGDPHATARSAARSQGDVNSNMVHNVRGAIH